MNFEVTEKESYVLVWLAGPDPWQQQTFFPIIDRLLERVKDSLTGTGGSKNIVFDFSSLNFIDSYMITMLVQCMRYTMPLRNVVIVPDNQIRSILSMLGIDTMMSIYLSFEEWNRRD